MSVSERVARGAALLDAKFPNWRERVDVYSLDMSSPFSCVLGQLFNGQYTHGLVELGIYAPGDDWGVHADHGFHANKEESYEGITAWDRLQNEWVRQIKRS